MGNFQLCDALSILFEFEKPPIKHLESFILLLREGGKLQKKLKILTSNSRSRIQKNSPTGLAKASASMVGRMFAITIMTC
jgi:hypothetical protein